MQISPRLIAIITLASAMLAAMHGRAQAPDSVQHRYDSLLKTPATKVDSLSRNFNNRIDSLQLKANSILQPDWQKLATRFNRKKTSIPDSLGALKELDSIKGGLRHKIDSLRGLNLSTDQYTAQLDSLDKLSPQKYIQLAQEEANELQRKLTQPAGELQNKITAPVSAAQNAIDEKLDLMKSNGGADANLPGNLNIDGQLPLPGNAQLPGSNLQDKLNVPGVGVPTVDLQDPLGQINNPAEGKLNDLQNAGAKLSDIKNIPQQKIAEVKQVDAISNASGKIGEGNALIDKGQAYQQDVANLAQGNIGEVKQLPDAVEKKLSDAGNLGELGKQEAAFKEQTAMLNKAKDPEALKQEAKKMALTQARDHFAGKQEVLQQAMDKMSKLKSKYSDVTSLAEIPKRASNAMKGKPFIERIVPGFNMQIQKSNLLLLDMSPVVTYKISGRVSAGVAWNERLAFMKWNVLSSMDRIYGPRAHTSFMLKKGFSLKAEGERMNTWVPTFAGFQDGGRGWVWSVFVGVKKDYQFAKGVRGNAQILYNIYDDRNNSPYVDRLNVRMGFEFPMKKKKRPVSGI